MPGRILIVDDSEHFRASASKLLTLRGFDVLAAVPDGEAARAAINGTCPSGVLLDINMQGEDGYTVARALSALCPNTKIVLMSSDTPEVPAEVLERCGAVAFVPKTELTSADLAQLFGS